MNGEERSLSIEEVEVGAVLAKDVLDEADHLLVPEGTELTEKMLQILNRRGIAKVEVVVPVKLTEEQREEMREAIQIRLDAQFKGLEKQASAQCLKQILLRYHSREL